MPTHLEVVPCPQSKVVRKFVRDVPCPQMKPKKKREVPCGSEERRSSCKQSEEVVCSNQKRVQPMTCPATKEPPKCVTRTVCPGKERKVSGCPKCESNRIQKLECEVFQLRKEIECMKYERKETEKAIQKAILRSAKALGGRMKPMIPDSIEKLLDTCDSTGSSDTSLTVCAAKMKPTPFRACQNKPAKKKDDLDCCGNCCL